MKKFPRFFIVLCFVSVVLSIGCTQDADLTEVPDSNEEMEATEAGSNSETSTETSSETSTETNTEADLTDKILIFSKTVGFRHSSISKGLDVFIALGTENSFSVDSTEDAEYFTTENLSQYQLVVFLNTTGDVLNDTQQNTFEKYIQAGGSFMGVHAATDTEHSWPWYGQLIGAYFDTHSDVTNADISVVLDAHASTENLPNIWSRNDEWYNFKNVNTNINVLLNLDETTYSGGTMGENHPIAWYHEFDGGRAFYTGGGHTEASYDEIDFQNHLLGGVLYCLKR